MNKTVIIGLGSGRSGTKSLAVLLDSQANTLVLHETNPDAPGFPKDMKLFNKRFDIIEQYEEQYIGDVSFYNIYYISELVEKFKDYNLKFIVIKRPRNNVINSYKRHAGNNDWWGKKSSDKYWTRFYPEYEGTLSEKIGKYWDWYYSEVDKLSESLDNMKIFNINDLNTIEGVNNILDFVGYSEKRNVQIKIQKNRKASKPVK